MSDLSIMADSAALTRDEMNVLYSPSCWCQRMSPSLVVDHHCYLARTGNYFAPAGADLGVTRVTSHPWRGSLFHVIIMRVTSYFDVVLCPSSSQIPQCSLASVARVPKVTPSKSANAATQAKHVSVYVCLFVCPRAYLNLRN